MARGRSPLTMEGSWDSYPIVTLLASNMTTSNHNKKELAL